MNDNINENKTDLNQKSNDTKLEFDSSTNVYENLVDDYMHSIDSNNINIKRKKKERKKLKDLFQFIKKKPKLNDIKSYVSNSSYESLDDSDSRQVKSFFKQNDKKPSDRPIAEKSTRVLAIIVSVIACIGIIGAIGAGIFAYKLCEGMPTLNREDLLSPDSSTIYDNNGNKIMEVGMYLRKNIDYSEMPNCLIDAFLSIEDSRYFEHFGFDIPRFTKALIDYIRLGGEISSGGSTITMQLIKNSYFSIDADDQSTIADREGMSGIRRKMQEIVLSIQLSMIEDISKQDIIAWYINKVNYGNNIRGVEKAANYYFGKSAKNLNLSESAFLAGIINSPNTYNPYNDLYKYDSIYLSEDSEYLINATNRRDEVLDLMVYHGYINEDEANLAKSIRIEDMLHGVSDNFYEVNDKYQWYIDEVIDEVEEVTGHSPYQVGMDIYTNMNSYMQELMYDIQNNEETMEFPNELCQSAIVLMDNQTGAIEALGGGRGERTSARQFNRATSAYLNPGSSFKPIVDYALALEYCGWSTAHTLTDYPYYLYNGNILISNYDHQYIGDMMMNEALGRSQNTPAVQTLAAVCEVIGEEKVVDYLNSIGFEFEYEDFDLQFAIGGNRCTVTPLQLAAAHAMFINGGRYIKPHTIEYIKYVDGRPDYISDTKGEQLLSKETAWMMSYLEEYNMSGPYSSLMWYCKRDYPLYGKTGTTDWADSGVAYGIPVSATKDSWLVMQTNRYTISCWTGYDELQEGAYFTNGEYRENTKSKIVDLILDELEEHASYENYDPYIELEKPDTVETIYVVKGTYPYVLGGDTKGYIASKHLETSTGSMQDAYNYSQQTTKYIDGGIASINGAYDGNNVFITFSVGSGEGGMISGDGVDLSTTNIYGKTTHASGRVWFPHWVTVYNSIATPPYFYQISVNGVVTAESATNDLSFSAPAPGGSEVKACMWTTDPENQICATIPIS